MRSPSFILFSSLVPSANTSPNCPTIFFLVFKTYEIIIHFLIIPVNLSTNSFHRFLIFLIVGILLYFYQLISYLFITFRNAADNQFFYHFLNFFFICSLAFHQHFTYFCNLFIAQIPFLYGF